MVHLPGRMSRKLRKTAFPLGGGEMKNRENNVSPRGDSLFYNLINFKTMEIKQLHKQLLQNMEYFQFAGHVLAM